MRRMNAIFGAMYLLFGIVLVVVCIRDGDWPVAIFSALFALLGGGICWRGIVGWKRPEDVVDTELTLTPADFERNRNTLLK